MNPIGPRERHLLEQLQALHLEVSVCKDRLRKDLIAAGLSADEAWEQAAIFERRALGSALDEGSQVLPVAEMMDQFARDLLEDGS